MLKGLRDKLTKLRRWFDALSNSKKQIVLVAVILASGISCAILLKFMKKAPAKQPAKTIAPLVKIAVLEARDVAMIVKGFGSVQPKVEADVVPQVSGKVVEINTEFKDGGFISADATLIAVDARDY